MYKFLIGSTAMAIALAVAPASAQVLGGGLGGGIGGGLGGGLGGSLGSMTTQLPTATRLPSTIDSASSIAHRSTGSIKSERKVDTRKGNVATSNSADGSIEGSLANGSNLANQPLSGSLDGAAAGSMNANGNAQLIGTDAVRSTAGTVRDRATTATGAARDRATNAVSTARDRAASAAGAARDRATGTVATVRDRAGTLTNATGSAAGAAAGSANGAASAGMLTGSANGSTNGSASATGTGPALPALSPAGTVGALRSTTGQAVSNTRNRATNAAGGVRDRAGMLHTPALPIPALPQAGIVAGSLTGGANGNAAGNASGGLGQLALAGSKAARGAGMFAVMPGMPVTDTKGRVIGTVQSVRNNAKGRIDAIKMTVGDRLATVPASNFNGEGNVLVSAMGKGALKKTASAQ